MRLNILEAPKVSSNYVIEDMEYIDDSYHILGRKIFHQICQLDNFTSEAMVAAAVAGYIEGEYGSYTSKPSKENWRPVPNKGYVALWVEEQDTLVYVFGLYRHDSRVYLYKVELQDLKEYVEYLDQAVTITQKQRLYTLFASFGPEYFRKG